MNPKQIVLSVRRLDNPLAPQWHAALIVDGQMDRVFVASNLRDVLDNASVEVGTLNLPVGTRIVARYEIAEPEAKPEGA